LQVAAANRRCTVNGSRENVSDFGGGAAADATLRGNPRIVPLTWPLPVIPAEEMAGLAPPSLLRNHGPQFA
jgi:hypothetical protein